MTWERLYGDLRDDPDAINEFGNDYDRNRLGRLYGQKGEPWPRISVHVTLHDEENTFSIECNEKAKPGDWWEKRSIPLELLNDVMDMLEDLEIEEERLAEDDYESDEDDEEDLTSYIALEIEFDGQDEQAAEAAFGYWLDGGGEQGFHSCVEGEDYADEAGTKNVRIVEVFEDGEREVLRQWVDDE